MVPCVWLAAIALVAFLKCFRSCISSNLDTRFKKVRYSFGFLCVQAVTASTLAFGYSTFLVHLSEVANCQSIVFANASTPSLVLTVDGNIPCYQWWQYVAIVFLACLAALPAAFCIVLSSKFKISNRVDSRTRDLLCSCFVPSCSLWSPLQMIFRLLMALVSSLVSDRVIALIIMFVIVLVMMLMSLYFRPWRVSYAQFLDVLCYTCLIIKIALSLSSSTVTAVARSPVSHSPITMILRDFVVADAFLQMLPVVILLAIYAVLITRALQRRRRQGSQKLSVPLVTIGRIDFDNSVLPTRRSH